MLLAVALSFPIGAAWAQNFPAKPVRLVASEAGGAGDIAARIIAQGVAAPLGQPLVVENRGGGVIPATHVMKAPPDGYTIMLHGSGLWLLGFMRDDVPWEPLRDFAPITLAVTSPNVVVVHPSLPVNSIKDLIAYAKARPGQLNDAGGQSGTASHLAGELFKAMTGVDMVRVPFKGVGPAINSLVAGQTQVSFTNPSAAMPHIKSGKLRALAVTSGQPSPMYPDMPTVAASGLPGYEAVSILGVFAPGKTPPVIVNRLSTDIGRFLKGPEGRDKFLNLGVEAVGNTPEQFAAVLKQEMATLGKVIKDRGIRSQ